MTNVQHNKSMTILRLIIEHTLIYRPYILILYDGSVDLMREVD